MESRHSSVAQVYPYLLLLELTKPLPHDLFTHWFYPPATKLAHSRRVSPTNWDGRETQCSSRFNKPDESQTSPKLFHLNC
jgi:hypothetical protein